MKYFLFISFLFFSSCAEIQRINDETKKSECMDVCFSPNKTVLGYSSIASGSISAEKHECGCYR